MLSLTKLTGDNCSGLPRSAEQPSLRLLLGADGILNEHICGRNMAESSILYFTPLATVTCQAKSTRAWSRSSCLPYNSTRDQKLSAHDVSWQRQLRVHSCASVGRRNAPEA
nr:hypothetical protein CFP56_64861 [Quercus suber]